MGILFQDNFRQWSRNQKLIPCSFTESVESYMKAAGQESWIHENNFRVPKQEIVLRYFTKLSVSTLRENWKRLHKNLKKSKIIYAAVIELTEGCDDLPNDCVHYHFLIDTKLDRGELMETMKMICLKSNLGVYKQDFDLIYPNSGIKDWVARKIHYFTKFNHPTKVILFNVGLRIRKFYYSSDWFIEQDGTPTKKSAILKRLKDEYKAKKGPAQSSPPSVYPFFSQYDGSSANGNN